MKLSPNFTLDEMTLSQTAVRKGINNVPPPPVVKALIHTASQLEKVRVLLNAPIMISSGYRSPLLNKDVGGAATSQHVKGEAVDFTAPKFGSPRQIVEKIRSSNIEFDQLILEFDRWVHISFKESGNRKQVLAIGAKL
jgi:hypothetical protein